VSHSSQVSSSFQATFTNQPESFGFPRFIPCRFSFLHDRSGAQPFTNGHLLSTTPPGQSRVIPHRGFFGCLAPQPSPSATIFYYAAALPQIDAHFAAALSPDARARFAYLCLRLYGTVFDIFVGFYGAETMLRGYLFVRSGYLSRWLGVLLLLGGTGFIIKNLCVVLAPQYDSMLFVIPMMVAMLAMAIWLPFKGIDRDRFKRLQAQDRGNN